MSYNPADDSDKLKELSVTCDSTDIPSRWVRCLAARLLEQKYKFEEIKDILRIVDDTFKKVELQTTEWRETLAILTLNRISEVVNPDE